MTDPEKFRIKRMEEEIKYLKEWSNRLSAQISVLRAVIELKVPNTLDKVELEYCRRHNCIGR